MTDSPGVVVGSSALSRQADDDDSATSLTSAAASSDCDSHSQQSDTVYSGTPTINCPDGFLYHDDGTLRAAACEPRKPRPHRPDDSWKALTQHVIGGGYQIRAPQRAYEYSMTDADHYR